MEYNLIMAYADGASVRGTPGLFYPADKARIDYLWRKIHSMDNAELSFAGDVDGYTVEDTVSGSHTVFLTVNGLDDINSSLLEIRSRLDQLDANSEAFDAVTEQINNRLDLLDENTAVLGDLSARLNDYEASLGAVAEEQLSYFKVADFNTVDGSLVFYDGLGDTAFTLGGATWETYTVEGSDGD